MKCNTQTSAHTPRQHHLCSITPGPLANLELSIPHTPRNPSARHLGKLIAGARGLMLVLLAMLCAAATLLAASTLSGRGSFQGSVTSTLLASNHVDLLFNLSGNVTHLGSSTLQLHSVADFSGSVPTPLPPSTGVITAANGDAVVFTLKWSVHELAHGFYLTFGPYEIHGGTGRFQGATGSGQYQGHVDLIRGQTDAEMFGELDLPKH